MAGKPYFPFYPGDWDKEPSLKGIDLASRGLWLSMIILMHESPRYGELRHPSGVPVLDDELVTIVGGVHETVCNALVTLERRGVFSRLEEDNCIICRRMWREAEAKRKNRDKVKRFRTRKKAEQCNRLTRVLSSSVTVSESKTTPKPPSGAEQESKPNPVAERFDEFWAAYPKRKGKGAARKAWDKIKPSRAKTDEILQALEAQKRSRDWTKDRGQFVPMPSTWLNQERWEDDSEVQAPESDLLAGMKSSWSPNGASHNGSEDAKQALYLSRGSRPTGEPDTSPSEDSQDAQEAADELPF